MGYDYQIQYRSDVHNQAADALSWCFEPETSTMLSLSVSCLMFLEELRSQSEVNAQYRQLREEIITNPTS